MKKFLLLLLITATMQSSRAQIALPTSWDCDPSTLPLTGWTTNMSDWYNIGSVGFYSSPPSSCKFSADSRFVKIFFSDAPGFVKYQLRGSSFSGGTFDIQESVDGVNWTNRRTFTNANINNNNLVQYTDTLNPASRYVRFFYTDKVSGNVAVDDIEILPRLAGPEAEISIKQAQTVIPSGTQFIIGNAASTFFKILNQGTDSVLHINSYSITGTDASMFAINNMPDSVMPNDSLQFELLYTPSGPTGTKLATISIVNNDDDEGTYVINIYAVNGSYATEPTAAPVNLTFSGIKSYTFNGNFANAIVVPEKYIILKQADSAINTHPVDGVTYKTGDYIGNAQVVQIGSAGTFKPSSIVANTTYHFAIYSFNGPSGYENYLSSSYLAGNVTTPPNMIGTYYNGINPAAPTFIQDLFTLINPHYAMDYGMYDEYLVNNIYARDTVVAGISQKVTTCPYSGQLYVFTDPFSWTVYNREHCYPQSWMPTFALPDFATRHEYSDYHNIFPVNGTVNGMRSNIPFGDVVTVQNSFLSGKLGLDTAGHQVFEPRAEHKGDIARTLFYMVACYNSKDGYNWKLPTYLGTFMPYGQDQAVLKAWHFNDLPDNFEMAKNDYVHAVQNNRNPFIDSINWVNLIDFYNMPSGIENAESAGISLSVYPNPATDLLSVDLVSERNDKLTVRIYNTLGTLVNTAEYSVSAGYNSIRLPLSLSTGMYLLKFDAEKFSKTVKISVR